VKHLFREYIYGPARLGVLFLLATFIHGTAADWPATTGAAEVSACLALREMDMSGIKDAPTRVESSKMVEASNASPAFCKVEAYVSPKVGIEVHLPLLNNWNRKLMTAGNSGWAGTLNGEACDQHVTRGYACVTTDTGHRGRGNDGLWAVNNLAAQVDFGYRAIHVATLAAKSIVSRYYTRDAQRAYFMGCSTGGYQGLVEAQRFPWDFDGIIAGAPDMDEADLTMREVWDQKSFLDKAGDPILDAGALKLLHQAALDQCDRDDGVQDGLISNPIGCALDPSKLLCKKGETQGCLNASQAEAAKRIYSGPPHTQERAIRGALAGSEMMWQFGPGTKYYDSLFQSMIYGATPSWTAATYDFEHDYQRLGMAALYTDTNPDLRRFKAAGGKLLVYQGGNDVTEMPTAIVDYYQTVEKVMGGLEPTQDFFRLFIVPGMNHCAGGVGASSIDYLSYLEAWVERNQAPDKMIGAHVSESYLASLPLPSGLPADATPEVRIAAAGRRLRFPLDPAIPVTFTRPMYPYPQFAKYAGGDANQASSFLSAQP
jgi:hypothetical protein